MDKQSALMSEQQPMIVKYVEDSHTGIQSQVISRYAIGYVLQGTKYIYDGDRRESLSRGDVFYFGLGRHYTENVPDANGRPFEQILFYYTPMELQRILQHLNLSYGLNISNNHSCEKCSQDHLYIAVPGWSALRTFFTNTNGYLRDEDFTHNGTADNIKMTELIYLIVSHEDGCLKNKLLSNIDVSRENFERIVFGNIFNTTSVEELARLTHRSLTSFKKEFKLNFRTPPHQWFIRQRLMHARLLLISTSKSISEVGVECTFRNTSHFIKLFKKEFEVTPASYRCRNFKTAPCQTPVSVIKPTRAKIAYAAI